MSAASLKINSRTFDNLGTDIGRGAKILYTAGLSETPVAKNMGRTVLRGLGVQAPDTSASDAQQKLEDDRRAQLAGEAAERAAAKKRAETAGSRAGGRSALGVSPVLGFGSGNSKPGSGNLFGN